MEKEKKLLQEEGRKVIDEIKSKRRKEQEKIKKEDQNMVHLEGGTYKKQLLLIVSQKSITQKFYKKYIKENQSLKHRMF